MTQKLKIAVQKSGRLSEKSIELLNNCGFSISKSTKILKATSKNYPLEILFLRDDDIPEYVENGVANLGIVGENTVKEHDTPVKVLKKLGFSKCRLSIAVPKDQQYGSIKSLEGKKIATSYPNILKEYLKKHEVQSEIHFLSGSVEIAPSIGLADAIFDIISTGFTLVSNHLVEVDKVMESEAILIRGEQKFLPEMERSIQKVLFRINTVQEGQKHKYLLMNIPTEQVEKFLRLIPGKTSPTIIPLADKNWSALHAIITENDFWEHVEAFQKLGAEGIITSSIEKMIP